MTSFTRRKTDGLTASTKDASGNPVSGKADDLSVFALLPVERSLPCAPLFARDVRIAVGPYPEDWESVHLDIM